MIRNFQLGATLAVALTLSILPNAGHAYTQEEQAACQPDAFRLCSSEIPNIPKITACMIKHRADLSDGCRAVMDKDKAQKSSTVAEQ